MTDILQCNIRDLEDAQMAILRFYKEQLRAFYDLKKAAER